MSNLGHWAKDRTVVEITGEDRLTFLQGLITNDVMGVGADLRYAALLSPQGKYLFDFLFWGADQSVFIDILTPDAEAFITRLNMYRLRASVDFKQTDLKVLQYFDTPVSGSKSDPRDAHIGARLYVDALPKMHLNQTDRWRALRVKYLIPETGIELIHNQSYILECGFERLNGVDFKKGCYVGQEVTARMKHKTTLKKGLVQLEFSDEISQGIDVTSNGKIIGKVLTCSDPLAMAYLKLDQVSDDMRADGVVVKISKEPRLI